MDKAVLKRNKKLNVIYDANTNLVIKSLDEKLVIGRIDNGVVIPLDDEAIRICDEHEFPFDESLMEDKEESDSDNKIEFVSESPVVKQESSTTQELPNVSLQESKPISHEQESKPISHEQGSKPDVYTEIQKLLHTLQQQEQDRNEQYEKRIGEFVKVNETLSKELGETKKKLMIVLSAMQNSL